MKRDKPDLKRGDLIVIAKYGDLEKGIFRNFSGCGGIHYRRLYVNDYLKKHLENGNNLHAIDFILSQSSSRIMKITENQLTANEKKSYELMKKYPEQCKI